MKNKLFLFFILFLLFHDPAQTQVPQGVTRSTIIERYKGIPYYLHFVKAGETLISISKVYGVTPEVILQENEEAGKGVYTDMLLKIPVNDSITQPVETTTKDLLSSEKRNAALSNKKEPAKKDIANTAKSRLSSPAKKDLPKGVQTVMEKDTLMSEDETTNIKEAAKTDSSPIDRGLKGEKLKNKAETQTSQKELSIAENIQAAEKTEKKTDLEEEGDNSVNTNKTVTKSIVRKPSGVPSRRIVDETSHSTVLASTTGNISQPQPKNDKKGRPGFIDYLVKSKETLYGISKTFNVSIDDILAANTGMGALKAGVTIKIPTIIYDQDDSEETTQAGNDQLASESNSKISSQGEKPVESRAVTYEPYVIKDVKTVAALSKATGLTKEELIAMNPGLKNGIKPGQVIKLPAVAENRESQDKIADSLSTLGESGKRVKTGTPKKEAVVNSVSRKESKSPETKIVASNQVKDPESKSLFSKIKIFPNKTNPRSLTDTCRILSNNDNEYNIALLMPFYLEDMDSTLLNNPENAREASTYPQYNFMQFYAGTLIALDSLDKVGFKANLHVYDVDHGTDTIKTLRLLSQPGFEKMDLIIGPIFANSFNIVAKYARKNEINIINPLAKRNNIIVKNPFVYKVQPGDYSSASILVNYLLKNYRGANVIVVRHDLKEQFSLVKEFISQAKKAGLPYKEIIYKTEGFAAISRDLKPDKQNIVVLLSANKVTVPDLTAKLNNASKSTDITLFGIPGWENIQIEPEFLSNLKTHLLSSSFVDYDDNSVKKFIISFREKFNTEPEISKNAFLGFDITWYFLNALKSYGRDYGRCLSNLQIKGLQSTFDFKCKIPGNGYENQKVDIIQLDGYHWVKEGD